MNAEEAASIVTGARSAADLFAGDSPARVYRRLARLLHPDVSPGTAAAFARLAELWSDYNHGQRVGPHRIGPLLHRGGTAVLYPADGDALLKLPRDPADNHLLVREAAALTQIASDADPRFLPYIPRLVSKFRHKAGRTVRQANVLSRAPSGFVTLTRLGSGLDPRDVAWIWRRLLVATGLAHRAGVTHGAVLPRHVLVHPIDHGLVLVDWCASQLTSASKDASDDVLGVTRCVAGLLGDHPRAMRAFVHGCLRRPPSDAWALLAELDELLEDLYGPRTYRPLHL
ncbi:molecular chaperone DnaJ [Nonomuraea guangzhouensis]|uniref:Molecular chaperone DnaJ n=1 Tax=Nonomuraea guangzhouensis TaxID=1291555 RepID=A0ABW4GXV7_9ACTN|nr:molecular chaperone DnaJ [Nonomuraea guangzhouensis]